MKIIFSHICCSILFGALTFTGCNKQRTDNPTTNPTGMNGKKYLALGDSYTIGQGVQPNERFPYLTVSLLRQQNFAMQDPQYIATTGWTTGNLLTAINNQGSIGVFDVVSLLIGVNDQYQGLDTAGYRTRFTQLLNKAVELAGNRPSRVFVLSIPDYSATPFVSNVYKEKVSKEIDAFNNINKQISLKSSITYIDITSLSREAANDLTLLADDRLHYSAKEHQKWAEKLAPLMKQVLQ
ncbi:MAG: SGNH/GDSL hydrolase family protein [Chitinophagaceae bacterium]